MKPARFSALLLISVSLVAGSCGSPPENSSPRPADAKPREKSAATAPPTETTREEMTTAPEKTAESAAKERTAGEREAKREPKPKGAPEGEVVEVRIRGLEYLPGPVTVSPGTTVRWVNGDRALHTVTSEGSGGPLASEELGRGDSYEYAFREPGQYDYYCVVHPFMKSGITVE